MGDFALSGGLPIAKIWKRLMTWMLGGPSTDDLVAAYHEAGHAVFAVGLDWVELVGPVTIAERGHGEAPVKLDRAALELANAQGDLDVVGPREDLINCFLAGAAAERRIVELRGLNVTPEETRAAARGDYAAAEIQLKKIAYERPLLTVLDYEPGVAAFMSGPAWPIIEQFADELLKCRAMSGAEAVAMIQRLGQELERATAADN